MALNNLCKDFWALLALYTFKTGKFNPLDVTYPVIRLWARVKSHIFYKESILLAHSDKQVRYQNKQVKAIVIVFFSHLRHLPES